jgi:AcrR family transcriptional regulator
VARKLDEHRHQAAKAELLRLASELFASKGVDGTSLADVADAAGITPAALYHYFADRRELVVEAMRYATWATVDNVAASEDATLPPLERLDALARRHVEFLEQSGPGMLRFIYCSVIGSAPTPELAAEIDPGSQAMEDFLRTLILDGQRDGTIRRDIDVGVLVELVTAFISGVDVRFSVERSAVPASELVEHTVAALRQFLSPPRSRR